MKFTAALVVVVLAAVQAAAAAAASDDAAAVTSMLTELPSCAVSCLGQVVPQTGCGLTNITCFCTSDSFRDGMTECVTHNCTIKEQLQTMNMTQVGCHAPIRDKTLEYRTIAKVLGIITGVVIIQRIAFSLYSGTQLHLDDLCTVVTALIGSPCTVISSFRVTQNGLGRDVWTLNYAQITNFGKYFFIQEVLYFAEVSLMKLALLFFYRRIFPGQRMRWVIWATILINCLFGLSFVMAAVFQCAPVSYFWVMWDGEHAGRCLDINSIAWANAAISIALDLWMLALPLSRLRNLNLGWKKKVGVGLMFFMGTFVTIVSILRLKSLLTFRSSSRNPTWEFWEVAVWSTVEINIGLICVCLPSVRRLLVHIFPKIRGTTRPRYDKRPSPAPQQMIRGNQQMKQDPALMKPLPAVPKPVVPKRPKRRFAYLKPICRTANGDLQLVLTGVLNTINSESEKSRGSTTIQRENADT